MSQINPFVGSILQASAAQKVASDTREQAVRKTQRLRHNAVPDEDEVILQVENADQINPSGDALQREKQQRQREPHRRAAGDVSADAGDGLDITA
ncbi:MAG TPA: hypothetical protein PKB10_06255 [Tepidisphaeraceae bacterium]|nr:hypothetical protein [Tepidisphaeraceae bacterium]